MSRERRMALLFGLGSTCFLIGPVPGYAQLVGGSADAATFFVGSVLFTLGGAVQTQLAWPERPGRASRSGRSAWWAAVIQSAGTVFFNVTTFRALQTSLSDPRYDRLVWVRCEPEHGTGSSVLPGVRAGDADDRPYSQVASVVACA